MLELIQYQPLINHHQNQYIDACYGDYNNQRKSKLSKYSSYINLPWQVKNKKIKTAQASELFRAPNPRKNSKFEQENFSSLTVLDKYKLKTYRQNSKDSNPRAIIAMFHPLHSHAQQGAHIAKYFAQKGITTVGYDYRGFGQSQGPRGLVLDIENHIGDAQKFISLVKLAYPNVPLFVFGLSLGGATAYLLTLKHRSLFEGAILQAPALMPAMEMSKYFTSIRNICKFMQYILPIEKQFFKVNWEDLIINPKVTEDRLADNLFINTPVKLRTMNTIFNIMETAPTTFSQYECPFMVVQGGLDKCIDPHVAFEVFSKTKILEKDKQILFYEDVWHDIGHDQKIEEINNKISEWILSRSEKANNR